MNRELSFFDLVAAMRAGVPVVVREGIMKGHGAIINGIAREDGSGRKWIITFNICVNTGPCKCASECYWDESKPCPFVQG